MKVGPRGPQMRITSTRDSTSCTQPCSWSAMWWSLMLLLVLHEGADDEERLQHEGVDGVAVCGAATHHRVRVGRGAHQAGARVTGLHNITLLTQLHTEAASNEYVF